MTAAAKAFAERLIAAANELADRVDSLRFADPVTHVYNPIRYAAANHHAYLSRYGSGPKLALFVGMNPGPWGMAQTGIPFGDTTMVREWLDLSEGHEQPPSEHPKRPIMGIDCNRSEVSGTRLWGTIRDRFEKPERFFKDFFVANYCPLSFMEASGRNRTPDKLPKAESGPLFEACDAHLQQLVAIQDPQFVIGVGAFAEQRIRCALGQNPTKRTIGRVLHPSPASPAANRDWAGIASKQLSTLGLPQWSRN